MKFKRKFVMRFDAIIIELIIVYVFELIGKYKIIRIKLLIKRI